jgi:hypothetical protein
MTHIHMYELLGRLASPPSTPERSAPRAKKPGAQAPAGGRFADQPMVQFSLTLPLQV